MREVVERVMTAAGDRATAPVRQMSDADLLACLAELHAVQQDLWAVAAHLTSEIERRNDRPA